MIINGGSRRNGGWWSQHLQNAETNERVTLADIVGLDAASIPDLFHELEILARNSGSKAQNYFYQANVNPLDHEHLTPEQRREATELLLENLGLSGQPHFVVEHEKEGRAHFHIIAFRIDMERGRAISDSLTAQIHERTSRALEIRFDLERGKSVLVPDREEPRPERGAKKPEIFRGAESGIDPETVKADTRRAREHADNGSAFRHALESSGDYILARGDRRDFVVIDRTGDDHSLGRRLGMKAKELRAYMADLDPANLPGVEQAKEIQRGRQQERAGEPKPEADLAMQAAYQGARGRYDDLRSAEPPPEIVRQFGAATSRVTEPAAPVFDREAASRAADERIIDAAIKQAASPLPEGRQQPEPAAGSTAPAETAAAISTYPAATAPAWEPDAGRELAATADATVDRATHAGAGLLGGLGKIFTDLIGWLADAISPPPPPTRDQAERMQRSAEEKATERAWQQDAARGAADHEYLLREIERSRQSADQQPTERERPDILDRYRSGRSRDDDEHDRGRERERDRY